jgi:hypothetical protein
MNIVLEGPDGAGKSTLAAQLSQLTGMPVVEGKGPPKSADEFHARCERYLATTGVIFDRHPCISERIYSKIVDRSSPLMSRHISSFARTLPFIIYVRPPIIKTPTNFKDDEDPVHVAAVVAHHATICMAYDELMLDIAHYVFRRGDPQLQRLLNAVSQFNVYDRAGADAGILPSPRDINSKRGCVSGAGSRWRQIADDVDIRA